MPVSPVCDCPALAIGYTFTVKAIPLVATLTHTPVAPGGVHTLSIIITLIKSLTAFIDI